LINCFHVDKKLDKKFVKKFLTNIGSLVKIMLF